MSSASVAKPEGRFVAGRERRDFGPVRIVLGAPDPARISEPSGAILRAKGGPGGILHWLPNCRREIPGGAIEAAEEVFMLVRRLSSWFALGILLAACGGKIAPEDTPVVPVPPASAPPGAVVPSLEAYCAATRASAVGCGEVCVSTTECVRSYANGSDAYRSNLVQCVADGRPACGYPGECVVERLKSAIPSNAQLRLALSYCEVCLPEEKDAARLACRDAAFEDRGQGSLGALFLAVGDRSASTAAEECRDAVRGNRGALGDTCELAFTTCVAKYLPIVAFEACP